MRILARGCAALALLVGCAAGDGADGEAAPARGLREVVFHGACDASGAVPLSDRHMVVADDEDNVLRVYDAEVGGPPLAAHDVSPALGLPLEGKKRPRHPELDLEAATRIGDRAYWVTSHGRDKKGRVAPARLRVFATTVTADPAALEVVGHPYDRLVDDLLAAPQLAGYGLAEAVARAPKDDGGLNLEGLTAAPDGQVVLAFRNPVPRGRALVVPIVDLPALVAGPGAGPARFGEPIELDLGGRGVRSLSWWRGAFYLIGGERGSGGTSTLYRWDGRGAAAPVASIDLRGYNPEGFFTPEDRDEILVLSDDGERSIDGTPCKKLKDPARRRFRGVWLRPTAVTAPAPSPTPRR